MPPRSVAVLLAVGALLVVALPLAGPGAATAAGPTPSTAAAPVAPEAPTAATPPPQFATTPPNETRAPSEVTWRVQLRSDGDARWHVSATFPIRNANDSAGFDRLVEQFNRSTDPLGVDTFGVAARRASEATGREMAVRDVARSSGRANGTGTLTVSFTWSNFARVDGPRLYVGDAFNTTTGTWLPSMSQPGWTLEIAPPSGYQVLSTPISVTDGVASWSSPYVFDGREPWIVYSGETSTPTLTPTPTPESPTPTPTQTATPPTGTPNGGGPLSGALPLVVVVLVAGASVAALAVYMRGDGDDDSGGAVAAGDSGGGATGDGNATGVDASAGANGAGSTGETASPETADGPATTDSPGTTDGPEAPAGSQATDGQAAGGESSAEAGAGAAAAGAAGGAATDDPEDGTAETGDDAEEADDGIDEELLSDEERVERLLDRNGGRMKQASIVKETGWSNAKVSQLLSSMADEDRVDKLRIGRENLISFPDEDITDFDSEE